MGLETPGGELANFWAQHLLAATDFLGAGLVGMAQNIIVKGISCGKNHCVAWDSEGRIYSWGDGSNGKLGYSSTSGSYNFHIIDPLQVRLSTHGSTCNDVSREPL